MRLPSRALGELAVKATYLVCVWGGVTFPGKWLLVSSPLLCSLCSGNRDDALSLP